MKLAGRAVKREMFPLCSKELGSDFSPESGMKFGSLPGLFSLPGSQEKIDFLYAYVETYLREEILREAVVRKLQNYQRFLKHAAIMNAQVTNMNNISREAGVARSTVEGYFEILVDTLLGTFVEPIHLKAKVKEVAAPKFYFFDCGVVRALRNELGESLGEQAGYLLETLLLNEIRAYSSYRNLNLQIHYWGTPSGTEVDFIICKGRKKVAVEVKSSRRWDKKFNKGLHSCASSNQIDKLTGVYQGPGRLKLEDVDVFPVKDFCHFPGSEFRINPINLDTYSTSRSHTLKDASPRTDLSPYERRTQNHHSRTRPRAAAHGIQCLRRVHSRRR